MCMHRLKTRAASSNLYPSARLELRIKNSNSRWNCYACVIAAGVDHDLKPRVNVQRCDLGEAWKREIPPSLALGEGVNAVADCADQYRNDNDRDDGSPLALPSNLLKHSLLTSLRQALPVHP